LPIGYFYFMDNIVCKNCGSIDDYTVIEKSNQHTAYCKSCGKYIKNIPQSKTEHLKMYFGKFKDKLISEVDDEQYLDWVLRTNTTLNYKYRTAIQDRINEIQNKE